MLFLQRKGRLVTTATSAAILTGFSILSAKPISTVSAAVSQLSAAMMASILSRGSPVFA